MSPVFLGSILLLFFTSWSNSITICSMKDENLENCLKDSIQGVVSLFEEGLPKYGVFPLDPFHIDLLDLSAAQGKALNIKHKFKDVDIYGLRSMTVKKVSIDRKNIELKVDVIMKLPITLIGFYESEGKLLSLPIKGDGRFNITLVNKTATLIMKGHEVEKNNKVYVHIDTIRFPFTVERLILNFENLLKGNKEISDSLNNILNENWEYVLEDVQESFQDGLGAAYKDIFNRVLTKVPITDLIKDY